MAKSTYRLHFRLRAMSQIAGRHLAFEVAVRCVKEERRGEVRRGEDGWISDAVQINREVDDHVRHMQKERCAVHIAHKTETGGSAGGR